MFLPETFKIIPTGHDRSCCYAEKQKATSSSGFPTLFCLTNKIINTLDETFLLNTD